MDTGVLIQGMIAICMGIPLFYLGYLVWKKSQNAKMCRGAYACMFRGPDKAWVRLLPAKNGLIQKPSGKYLLKKERGVRFSWPEAGYVVPKDMPIPSVMWPLTGSDFVKVPVGILIYDIGNPMPQINEGDNFTEEGGIKPLPKSNLRNVIDPDTINNIHDADVARQIFIDIPNEMDKGAKGKGKVSDLMPYIILIAIGITLILVFMLYTNQGSMANDLNQIKGGMGY